MKGCMSELLLDKQLQTKEEKVYWKTSPAANNTVGKQSIYLYNEVDFFLCPHQKLEGIAFKCVFKRKQYLLLDVL